MSKYHIVGNLMSRLTIIWVDFVSRNILCNLQSCICMYIVPTVQTSSVISVQSKDSTNSKVHAFGNLYNSKMGNRSIVAQLGVSLNFVIL